jgi:hypothetical protein
MNKLKDLFSNKPKVDLPTLDQVQRTKKEVRDALRKLNQQNRRVAQIIKEKTAPEDLSQMDKDIDCTTCKKFSALLNNKEKLNSLNEKQKQGAKVARDRCQRCKVNFCDENIPKYETIEDLELCTLITHILDYDEIILLLNAFE